MSRNVSNQAVADLIEQDGILETIFTLRAESIMDEGLRSAWHRADAAIAEIRAILDPDITVER